MAKLSDSDTATYQIVDLIDDVVEFPFVQIVIKLAMRDCVGLLWQI